MLWKILGRRRRRTAIFLLFLKPFLFHPNAIKLFINSFFNNNKGPDKAGPCRKCQSCLVEVRGHCYPVLTLINPSLSLWGSTRYYLMSSKKRVSGTIWNFSINFFNWLINSLYIIFIKQYLWKGIISIMFFLLRVRKQPILTTYYFLMSPTATWCRKYQGY